MNLEKCTCGWKPKQENAINMYSKVGNAEMITRFICRKCLLATHWYKTVEEAETAWNEAISKLKKEVVE